MNETPQFPSAAPGVVLGAPNLLLRAEGALVFGLTTYLYAELAGGWILYLLFFLVPDVSMLGYLKDRRFGARVYNLGHVYIAPAILGGFGYAAGSLVTEGIALIWAAHIGLDRVLGYGLKYPTAFGATHLGWMGRVG